MRTQIRGEARRNGPVYRFGLVDGLGSAIVGHSSRYRIVFRSVHDIDDGPPRRIRDFLRSLELGTLLES